MKEGWVSVCCSAAGSLETTAGAGSGAPVGMALPFVNAALCVLFTGGAAVPGVTARMSDPLANLDFPDVNSSFGVKS